MSAAQGCLLVEPPLREGIAPIGFPLLPNPELGADMALAQRLLLSLPWDAPVLLAGPVAAPLAAGYRCRFAEVLQCGPDALPQRDDLPLVVADLTGLAPAALDDALRRLRSLLAPGGALLLANGDWPESAWWSHGGPESAGGRRLRLAARRAGLDVTHEFSASVGAETGAGAQVSPWRAMARQLISRLGIASPSTPPGQLHVAGAGHDPLAPLVEAVRAEAERAGEPCGPLHLSHFTLRRIGALVLVLHGPRDGVVARAAIHPEVAPAVVRNQRVLELLHTTPNLGPVVRFLPRPIAQLRRSGLPVTLETELPGVFAWRVHARPDREAVAFRGAVVFARTLAGATARIHHLSENEVDRTLLRGLAEVGARLGLGASMGDLLHLGESVREHLSGRTLALALSHGDFGYANLLVDPRSGRLSGVIDWHRAREREPVGVDLFNLLLMRESSLHGRRLAVGFAAVWERLLAGRFTELGIDPFLGGPFGLAREDLPALLLLALLRVIERAACCATEGSPRRQELLDAIVTANNLVTAVEVGHGG